MPRSARDPRWKITDHSPSFEDALYGRSQPRVKTMIKCSADGSIQVLPFEMPFQGDGESPIREPLGKIDVFPYGTLFTSAYWMDLDCIRPETPNNAHMQHGRGDFYVIAHFEAHESHEKLDEWWNCDEFSMQRFAGFPIHAHRELSLDTCKNLEFIGSFKFCPLKNFERNFLNHSIIKPIRSLPPRVHRKFIQEATDWFSVGLQHAAVQRVHLAPTMINRRRTECVYTSLPGLVVALNGVLEILNRARASAGEETGLRLNIPNEITRQLAATNPFKTCSQWTNEVNQAVAHWQMAHVSVSQDGDKNGGDDNGDGGGDRSLSPHEPSQEEQARRDAYWANVEAERTAEKVKELARKERAAATRAAKLETFLNGGAPYSVTMPQRGKTRSSDRVPTTEEKLVHEEHVNPQARALRQAAFDAKQAREHAEAEAKKLRDKADSLKALVVRMGQEEAAASHHVPPGPTLADFM